MSGSNIQACIIILEKALSPNHDNYGQCETGIGLDVYPEVMNCLYRSICYPFSSWYPQNGHTQL